MAFQLPQSRSLHRYIGSDVRKDGTTVKAQIKRGEGCEEFDLLLTDIPDVIKSGVETCAGNADFATPMFTEVTRYYTPHGVYAGVSITSTEMFSQFRVDAPSSRGSSNQTMTYAQTNGNVATAVYSGVVTQFNLSNRRWRNGQFLLMGPEYMPEANRSPRVTWYPVDSYDLFHSSIAALLATAFGTWYKDWDVLLSGCLEPAPVCSNEEKNALPVIDSVDGEALRSFLDQQQHFPWTRIAYVTAKIVGTRWNGFAQLNKWMLDFYTEEAKGKLHDESTVKLLAIEQQDLEDRLYAINQRSKKSSPGKYTSTMLANATAIDFGEISKRSATDGREIEANPIAFLEKMEKESKEFNVAARIFMMGVYKLFLVNHLRGQAMAVVLPNGRGLVKVT